MSAVKRFTKSLTWPWFTSQVFSFNLPDYIPLRSRLHVYRYFWKTNSFHYILTSQPHSSRRFRSLIWRFLKMPSKVRVFLSVCPCGHVKPCIWEMVTSSPQTVRAHCCFVSCKCAWNNNYCGLLVCLCLVSSAKPFVRKVLNK